MKKQTLAAFLAFIALFSCCIISASAATPAEIQAEEDRVKALIASLDAQKITKVTIEQINPNGRVVSESSSKDVIVAWVDLFKRMEITGVEFEYLTGSFGTIYINDERGKVRIGNLTGGYLTNEGTVTMVRIDNSVELNSEMEKAVGMVVKWWAKLPAWLQWILRYIFFGWIWMR